jgi:hypothetical protein
VAFSPDGTRVLSGSLDGTIKIWDPATGELHRTPVGHCAAVNAAVYSSDGTRVLSGSNDSTVRLWDASTGDPLATFIAGDELWIALTPAGFFTGSAGAENLLSVVRGLEVRPIAAAQARLQRPDLIEQQLAGDRDRKHADAAERLDLGSLFAGDGP